MVAAAYAYFHYTYSRYNVIDFSQWTFYAKEALFVPDKPEYIVLVFSSRQSPPEVLLDKINPELPVIAVDLSQHRFEAHENVTFVTAGINTLLPMIQRFHLTRVPAVFAIEQKRDQTYKQSTAVEFF